MTAPFVLIVTACQSTPEEIPPNLTQMEMFQRAQEAADAEHWDTALLYYTEFIERFPDDPGAIVEAEYEIAFIAYKQERYPQAQAAFEALLAKYESDDADQLPEWPRVLSERLLQQIEEITAQSEAVATDESVE